MDLTKYNLRCNRSISEKMMKKDFIYDIKSTQLSFYKTSQKSMKPDVIYQFPHQVSINNELRNYDGELLETNLQLPVQRSLNFECNFCHESLATLFSLSTHVKFHLKEFCKKCYWILENNESIKQHVEQKHSMSCNQILL
ncbi:uncharacterized protein [Chelonus insularis]|uniref:uncharacterized protein n=1 Tax=Chelonus insularis TaxID=460826 RepID=UPI00158B2067|nr:uncharacterized protein LOC118064811 [Chelonus insularis]